MLALLRRAASPALALTVVALGLTACSETSDTPATLAPNEARNDDPGVHRQYGPPLKVGDGRARSYVVLDQKSGTPREFGVAFDSTALHSLPAAQPGTDPHHDHQMYLLPLPQGVPAPYKLVELDWNPQGHGAPYEAEHFDFHFYTISLAERNRIDPADPAYATKAANFPAPEYIRPGWVCPCTIFNIPPVATAVPFMGVHFIDVKSPEFYGAPFTTTMINGTWDGKVIFQEPMITRAFIMSKPDTTISLPLPERADPAGWYPANYSIKYDAQAREYRIALGALTWIK